MNFKSLLLGSAAALVAVSGARAADAVIAPEPEPVEYVRICDMYGAGFYYIPGTEVCLRIGGYVQYDLGVGDIAGRVSDTGDDTYYKRARFQLRVSARQETELGTLEGVFAYNFDWITGGDNSLTFTDTNGNGIVDAGELTGVVNGHDAGNNGGIERAWVRLGGLMWGVEDSQFVAWTGYASGVSRFDGLISYGPFTTHQISYTFDAGNGFSAMAGVEEGSDNENYGSIIQDYAPHVVAGAKYATGIFEASAIGAYDSVEDEFAVKGRLDVKPNDMFSLFVMGAWTDDDNGSGGNYYAQWGGDWAVWAGVAVEVSDRFTLNGEFGYNELEDYSLAGDVNIHLVGRCGSIGSLCVTPGVQFRHGDGDPLSPYAAGDQWGGNLRTRYTF